jgi:hypothetical protein
VQLTVIGFVGYVTILFVFYAISHEFNAPSYTYHKVCFVSIYSPHFIVIFIGYRMVGIVLSPVYVYLQDSVFETN